MLIREGRGCREGLPCSSNGKEFACNAGDPGSILGSGRSPGEGNGTPLFHLCLLTKVSHKASQSEGVKSLPAMQETRVRSLGQEDPLEKAVATYSSTLAWKIPWTEEPGRPQSMGSPRAGHD